MLLMLIGKVLGLFRDIFAAAYFGSGMEMNAFTIASQIPRNFFDFIFATAITASFIPVFSNYLTTKSKKEAYEFAGNFITIVSFFMLLLTVLGIVFAAPLVKLFAPAFDAQTAALCVSLTRFIFPTVFFTGVAFCFVGILQSLDEFNIPALISVIANLIIIVYYLTLSSKFGVYGLTGAYLLGWFVQAAMQVPSLIRKKYHYIPSLNFRSEGMKKVYALMLPALVSTWVQPLNIAVNGNFGSRLYNGTGVTAINFANNLYLMIAGVFILSVTNVMFPKLARLTAANDTEQFQNTIQQTVHTSIFFVAPMTAGLMVLAHPIISITFGNGKYDAFAVSITAEALTFLSLGMIGYALQVILSRAYFAKQRGRIPLVAGVIAIATNIALSALLIGPLGVSGLAISSTVAATVNAVVMIIPLEAKKEGFITKAFLIDLLKMLLATLVMAGAAWGLLALLSGAHGGKLWLIITVSISVVGGLCVYGGLTALFGLSEARTALGMAKKLLKRGSA